MPNKPICVLLTLVWLAALNSQLPAQVLTPDNDPRIAERDQLWDQAMALAKTGKLGQSKELFERVYQMELSIFGDKSEELDGTLNILFQIATAQQKDQAIIGIRERELKIAEKRYGKNDYRTQDAERAVTDAKQYAARSPEVRAILEQATELNAEVVRRYNNGDHIGAVPIAKQALEIRKQLLGKQHADYALSLFNLAAQYASLGDYVQAEPLYREALAIREKVMGRKHPSYTTSLNELAVLYYDMGDYVQAKTLFHEAITIRDEVLGKEHPDYASSLHHLAGLYLLLGDYPQAEPLYREAMVIREKVLGKKHPEYSQSLNNLAGLYSSMGDDRRAEPLYREAMLIIEKVLGKEHPGYATYLNNLARLYRKLGDYPSAEPLFREAMGIREKVLGKGHPDYANSLNSLAVLYRSMGDNRRAEPLYREAMAIREKVLGKEHPDYATSLNNLAALYQSMADYPRAEPLYREAVEISLRNLESTADVQSQRQQVRMGKSLRYQLDSYLSLAVKEPQFQPAAFGALLRWKGSVWQRQQRGRLLIDEPSLQPQFEALQQVSSKLSTLILRVPEPNQREAWRRQLDELTDEREKLERDLSLASVAFRQASTPATPEQMRDSLPDGAMLVDFLEYTHYTPANQERQTKNSWERRLLVHLVRSDQDVRAIDLGPVDAIADLVQSWRRDLGGSPAAADAAKELRQRIWQPLAEHLSGITMVYISPDGVLGQFPLAALPGKEPGSYLIEEIAIVILPVPQVLASKGQLIARSNDAGEDRFCLVGGVDYDQVAAPSDQPTPATPTTEPAATGPQLLAVRGGEPMVFTPLPGTVGEIETIESLLQKHRPSAKTTILSGAQASEAAFSRVAPGNRYLHVATHGFFAPPTVTNALTAATPDLMNRMLGGDQARSPQLVGEHPDLLSGLVFAGANKPTSDEEDGILTAAEVQELDLRGVELAILSACETGLGATAGGEGIIGLQRAFQLAGVETTITSLWQVSDAATKALMIEFYRNLFERKLGKYESLRRAQLTMLNHYDATTGSITRGLGGTSAEVNQTDTVPKKRLSPALWAAFQLSGEWR